MIEVGSVRIPPCRDLLESGVVPGLGERQRVVSFNRFDLVETMFRSQIQPFDEHSVEGEFQHAGGLSDVHFE